MQRARYKRILLKISGEVLTGDKDYGIDPQVIRQIAHEVKEVGNLGVFLVRILLTFPLHTGTILIMIAFSLKKKLLIIPGLVCAIIIHALFNYLVSFI